MSFVIGFVVGAIVLMGLGAAGLMIANFLKARSLARVPAPGGAPHPGPHAKPQPPASAASHSGPTAVASHGGPTAAASHGGPTAAASHRGHTAAAPHTGHTPGETKARPTEAATAAASAAPGFGKRDPMQPALRAKIRDRYIAARFAGVAKCSADLRNFERVIKAARLFFEEECGEPAMELLALAIEEDPACEPTRLAQLELAFLLRDASFYSEAARALRGADPHSPAWSEVARLGRAIAPHDEIFGAPQGPRAHEHYGAWPDMPNWLHASWDLTAEVRATDFHRAVMASAPAAGAGH